MVDASPEPDPVHSPEDTEGAKKKNKNKKKKKKSGGGGGDSPNQNADEAEGASAEANGSSPETARATGGSVSSPGTEASATEAAALAAFDPSSPEDRPMTQSLRTASLLRVPSWLCHPWLASLSSRGLLSRLQATICTRNGQLSRPGPNATLRCGPEARPKSPILRLPTPGRQDTPMPLQSAGGEAQALLPGTPRPPMNAPGEGDGGGGDGGEEPQLGQTNPPGRARARPLGLLGARTAALAGSALPRGD